MNESLQQTTLVPLGTLLQFENRWLRGLATGLSHWRPGISHAVIHVGFLMNQEIPLL
jgi:hypothetical protein